MASPDFTLHRLCVFCGASSGTEPIYKVSAHALGEELVKRRIGLVYGGGNVGLMGEIATAVVRGLGDENVLGIMPRDLAPREVSGDAIGVCKVVNDMHERKALMAQTSDGFIAMPGGFGTLEELMEVITWQQLGFHKKPIGLYNVNGFYDKLLEFFKHATDQGFIRPQHTAIYISSDPNDLIAQMEQHAAPPTTLVQHLAKTSRTETPTSGLPTSMSVWTAGPESSK